MTAVVIQVDGIIMNALVGLETSFNQIHCAGHKEPECHDDGIDTEICPDHDGVETGHDQNCQVFIEILDSDRVAGAHEDVAAVL